MAQADPPAPRAPLVRADGPALILFAGKERSLLRRHPWIYASAVEAVAGEPASGQTVDVVAADGRWLCRAAFSPSSGIRARAWTFDPDEPVDAALLRRRIAAAVARRAPLQARTSAVRLVFGEADQLPGLVVDRYADTVVFQLLAAGVEAWRDVIVEALAALPGVTRLHERSDAAARTREGLAGRDGPVPHDGADPAAGALLVPVVEDGIPYLVDVGRGHKTGFYIDQRDNRLLVRERAASRRVLNCFCYTGGFSWAAAAGGARSVLSIDSSADALALARRHPGAARDDGAPPEADDARMQWLEANVFDALKDLSARGEMFDLIVLDPPKFAPSAQHVERAARAYKEINLKALRLLAPGGLLLTFSCSGAIDADLFRKIVAAAVFDAGVECQMLQSLAAGDDHPVLMTHPEGEYLKGLLLRRL